MNMNAISKYLQVFKKPNANQTVLENIGVMHSTMVLEGSGFQSQQGMSNIYISIFSAYVSWL